MGRLFWKIFFGFWLTLLLTGSVVGGLVWLHNRDRIEQLEVLVDNPRADMGVNMVARILRLGGTAALEDMLTSQQGNRRHRLPMLIVDDMGRDLLGRPVPELVLRKAREALADPGQAGIQQVTTPRGQRLLVFIPRRGHPSMHHVEHFPRNLPRLPLLIPFIGSLLFSAALAWYITRPIRFLREATNQFAEGRLDTRVMSRIGKRRDEITDLARDFDDMAEQVQQLVTAQKRLLNDVSHELRSPLARLQVAIEMGRQQPQKLEQLLQRVEKESHRLDELVGELLTLSRLEASVNDTTHDYFDISGLVAAIADDAGFEASSFDKQVVFQQQSEILIYGNMELLRRAIENVVRNAVYYTPEHSRVEINLVQSEEGVEIRVCDCGRGVAEEKLPGLFQPFIRVDETDQNVKIPGYGLGLAIARRAVEIHHGSIRAYNRKEGGLCIVTRLPLMGKKNTGTAN